MCNNEQEPTIYQPPTSLKSPSLSAGVTPTVIFWINQNPRPTQNIEAATALGLRLGAKLQKLAALSNVSLIRYNKRRSSV
ncbi:hypothetical protein BDN70DRAFT_886196 [Pholiota conissans]|uniref:Uncharacterized protein n=1 Tax=Pholiota conissans TaxID=109636 RepID=A0A9P5YNL8_9AGAR|nr:hypothetical protein BDN70DRAFT_886196 [Pholiota conissans]